MGKNEVRKELEKSLYKKSFFEFVKKSCAVLEPSTNWKWNFHHEYICDLLQAETIRIQKGEKKTQDVIINVPFRSSKSLIVSILYPIWSWIVAPDLSFINLSYSANLSSDHSNKVVALINSIWFQELFGWEFEEVHKSKTDFKLKGMGASRISGGVVGTVLGRGGDIIVLDDPNNTRKLSEVERNNTIQAWKDTLNTRLNDPEIGIFIIIQQRLHTQDLTGYLIEADPDRWLLICLPAELSKTINPPHLAAEYVDGLLWGDRFSIKVLSNFKVTLGSVGYANQLMQSPSDEAGNIIKREWMKTITLEKFQEKCKINGITPIWNFFLDSAQTEAKKNDPSGILVCAKILNDVYVRKVIERRLTFPDLIKELDNIMLNYGVRSSRMFVEPKSNGKDIIAQLRRQTSHNIIELPSVSTDKESRLNAVAPLVEAGRMIMIEDISNKTIEDQLSQFPNAKHDEFCDLTGYALTRFLTQFKTTYATG